MSSVYMLSYTSVWYTAVIENESNKRKREQPDRGVHSSHYSWRNASDGIILQGVHHTSGSEVWADSGLPKDSLT